MKRRTERRRVVSQELEGIDLGDERRAKRARLVAERLAENPEASLPSAMGDEAATEALYRHLGASETTLEAVLEPHVVMTVRRAVLEETVYAVGDTTSFVFSGDGDRDGLGTISGKDQGFLAHVTLAVAADRTPLGVLAVEAWSRPELKGKREMWDRRHDAGRESLRWARGMRQAHERLGKEAGRLIHVADREGDIYELIAELVREERRFIIRASQNRLLIPLDKEDEEHLFDAARHSPTTFTLEVPLSARKGHPNPARRKVHPTRRERMATLSFAARSVTLKRPMQRGAKVTPSVAINIVHVFELGPPVGEQPVEWLLLTSEPVTTDAEVRRVVDGYRLRWVIEEYFKAVKTGCAFESRQLESAQTLQALLAYTLIVAYALLLLRAISRTGRDDPADSLLSSLQLKLLRAKVKKLPDRPTAREALVAIAGMGGHLRNNGDPGWRTLSKGWVKLLALEEGYLLGKALAEK